MPFDVANPSTEARVSADGPARHGGAFVTQLHAVGRGAAAQPDFATTGSSSGRTGPVNVFGPRLTLDDEDVND